MQVPEPTAEHRWLHQLLGVWDTISECQMGPDQPPMKSTMVTTMRKLGELWVVGDIEGDTPGGTPARSIISLGFDPVKNQFVGSFISSMMTHLWPYAGTLDAAKKVLTLDSSGPGFDGSTDAKYQDIIEIVEAGHYIMRSQTLSAEGDWVPFMVAHYHLRPEVA